MTSNLCEMGLIKDETFVYPPEPSIQPTDFPLDAEFIRNFTGK